MPSPLQWRRARAIHSLFRDIENVDSSVHQLVFAFCDCPPQVFSAFSGSAFALLTDWGAVVTWGDADGGGDSRGVAAQLSGGVRTVVGTTTAFAAVKVDGSVVTWGHADYGGDSRGVAAQLSGGVQTVVGTGGAFAAVKVDGSVVTWGDADGGGDSRGVAAQLSGGADCWRLLPDLTDGTIVLLVGLQRAELNGRRAVVRQPVVPSKPGRVGVEVDGTIVAIKRENLESS